MKKSMVLLAGVSMAFIGLPAVSHAQAASGPFADVPTDHWAYQSVDTLQKAGIVIGYPDGTYGGRRPMTRYEFAVAIARLLAQIKNPSVSAADLAALRTDLESKIDGNTAAIDALRALVNGFQPELTRLGVDVDAAKARLDALEARVTNLEGKVGALAAEQARLHITGDVNIIYEGRSSRHKNADGTFSSFTDKNGTTIPSTGFDDRLLGSSDVYNDILLHLRGKVADNATANVDLDFGNYLSAVGNTAAFGNTFGGITPGGGAGGASNQYASVYKAYLDAAVKLGPLGGAQLLVGRFGNQYTKYTLKQADADIYTNLIQTDSGDIITDGGSIGLKAGPVHLNAFAGKFNESQFSQPYGGSVGYVSNGNPFSSPQSRPGGLIAANHAAPLNDGYGVRATVGAPEGAVLGFTLEQFGLGNGNYVGAVDGYTDPNRSTLPIVLGGTNGQYNRLSVYGADFNGALPFGIPGAKKGGILIDAAYTVSAHGFNQGFNNIGSNFRYQSTDDQLGFAVGPVNLKAGYQYVGPEFSAPGYWGKIGAWTNPTNVKGPVVSAKYSITPKLSFNADGQFYKAAYGANSNGTLINSPLQQNDHLNRYQVGFGYGLTSNYGVDLGYEDVQYDLRNQNGTLLKDGRPEETYVNIGLGHTISPNASIKLLYQIVHYDDKGTGFDSGAGLANGTNNGKENGSVATAQFQLKF